MRASRSKPSLSLEFTSRGTLGSDPSELVHFYECRLAAEGLDDGSRLQIGGLEAAYVDVTRMGHRGNVLSQLATHPEVRDCCTPFIDPASGLFTAAARRFLHNPASANILIIERLWVLPEFRGQHLGLLAVRKAIQLIGRECGAVVVKPYPLQFCSATLKDREFTSRMLLRSFRQTRSEAFRKVQNHYGSMGFQRFQRSEIWALNPERKQRALRPPHENHIQRCLYEAHRNEMDRRGGTITRRVILLRCERADDRSPEPRFEPA